MDTNNSKINTESQKTDKAKKMAGSAAKFAAAAGLGVAGTMAAEAMDFDNEDLIEEVVEEVDATTEGAEHGKIHAETAHDFNPNDIVIDADDVVVADDDIVTDSPTPITGHDDTLTIEEINEIEIDDDGDDIGVRDDSEYDDTDYDTDDFDIADDIVG